MVYLLSALGIMECDGDPTYYLDDTTMNRVLNDQSVAKKLYEAIGTCCIGRLGVIAADGV